MYIHTHTITGYTMCVSITNVIEIGLRWEQVQWLNV